MKDRRVRSYVRRHKKFLAAFLAVIASGAVSLFVNLPLWGPYCRENFGNPFYVIAQAQLRGDQPLALTTDEPGGLQTVSLDLAIYWKVTNTSSSPREVTDYAVAVQTSRRLVRLRHVHATNPLKLLVPQRDSSAPETIRVEGKYFEPMFKGAVIEPGHSLAGYVFLEWGSNIPPGEEIVSIRITISDSRGRDSVAIIPVKAIRDRLDVMNRQGRLASAGRS